MKQYCKHIELLDTPIYGIIQNEIEGYYGIYWAGYTEEFIKKVGILNYWHKKENIQLWTKEEENTAPLRPQ